MNDDRQFVMRVAEHWSSPTLYWIVTFHTHTHTLIRTHNYASRFKKPKIATLNIVL